MTPLPGCVIVDTDAVVFCYTTYGHSRNEYGKYFSSYCAIYFLNDNPDFSIQNNFPLFLEPRELYLE